MKNLKVSWKLSIGFGVVLIMFLISVILSTVSLRSVSNDLDEFYNRPFANVALAIQSDMDSEVAAKYMLRACLETNTSETEQMLSRCEENLQTMREQLNLLKNTYSGDPSDIADVETELNQLQSFYEEYAAMVRINDNINAYAYYKANIVNLLTDITASVADITTQANTFATQSHDNGMAASKATTILIITLGVLAILIGIALALYITRGITKPVIELEDASKRLSQGDFNASITYESKDELGGLSNSLRETVSTLKAVIQDLGYQMSELASGNLTVHSNVENSYVGELAPILSAIRKMKQDLNNTMEGITNASDQVDSGAEQVSSAAQALAQGSTEQASSVQELAATINDISNQVSGTAGHAETAKALNVHSHDELQNCATLMGDLVGAMQTIEEKSNEVSKVIKVIEDIAFQTNILALNAAVEAARAGSAGKGFAVVADEVRNLASKSAEAAKNTTSLIEESIQAVSEGARISSQTSESLDKVVADAKSILEAVTSISDATAAQSESIKQVTLGIDQISSVVQTNSATAEETAAASEELSAQSQALKELVSVFTLVHH